MQKTGHGGNVELKRRGRGRYEVTVLEVVNSDTGIERVEDAWKRKLITRKFGLSFRPETTERVQATHRRKDAGMNRLADTTAPEPEIDVDEFYSAQLKSFTETLSVALVSSQSAAGLDAGYRQHWASVLFTRLCSIGVSLLYLCPGSEVSPDSLHWDFSSAASLARNLLECDLFFFYLCIDPADEDVWLTRLNLMQLHDCLERHEMFRCWEHSAAHLKGFLDQADELKDKLSKRASFNALSGKLRKELLKGKRSQTMTQDEILLRMGVSASDVQHFRGYYRFLSSQAHTYPLGFYRTSEQNRTGLENRADKGYIAAALEFCGQHLNRAVQDFQRSFGDLIVFDHQSFDWKRVRRAN